MPLTSAAARQRRAALPVGCAGVGAGACAVIAVTAPSLGVSAVIASVFAAGGFMQVPSVFIIHLRVVFRRLIGEEFSYPSARPLRSTEGAKTSQPRASAAPPWV